MVCHSSLGLGVEALLSAVLITLPEMIWQSHSGRGDIEETK